MRGRPPKRCLIRRGLLKVQSNFVRENRWQNEHKRRRIRHESYSFSVTFQPVAILHEKTQGKTKVTQTRAGDDLAPRVCPPDPQAGKLNENPSPGGLSGKIETLPNIFASCFRHFFPPLQFLKHVNHVIRRARLKPYPVRFAS